MPEPASAGPEPASEEPEPASERPEPASEGPELASEGPKPASEGPKPASKGPKPDSEGLAPASEEPEPASEEPEPASEEPKPSRVDGLRRLLLSSGAAAVVTCQIKPTQLADVRPYNQLLHRYLANCGQTGYGCPTQIRMDYLRPDGVHINPQYDAVLDRTYAYAIRGIPVPSPTPQDDFVPSALRRRWESDWPRLVGSERAGQGHVMSHHGR